MIFRCIQTAIKFRQRRYFYYLTGVDFPDAQVTYNIETDTLSLYLLQPDPKEKLWFVYDISLFKLYSWVIDGS